MRVQFAISEILDDPRRTAQKFLVGELRYNYKNKSLSNPISRTIQPKCNL